VHSGAALSHLNERQREIFDYAIPALLEPNCGAKLHAYEHSPFERTLVLDADMLWLPGKKPSELFAELEGVEFTCISEGNSDKPAGHYFFWAGLEEIRTRYNVKKVWQLRTEVMYFTKSPENEAVFADAVKVFAAPGLATIKKFAHGVPDELAMNIACAIHEVEPHRADWKPSYWARLHRDVIPEPAQLYRDYYLISAGGNHATPTLQKFYNSLVKAQARKVGHNPIFSLQDKFQFLNERRDG
jgi:hypothetical protein